MFLHTKTCTKQFASNITFLNIPELVLKTVKRTGYQNERTLMTQNQRSVLSQK